MKTRITAIAAALFGTMLVAQPSVAITIIENNIIVIQHMALVSSNPPPNVALKVPPASVTLYFSAQVNPGVTQLNVFDPYGNKISSDPMVTGNSVSVSLAIPESGYAGGYNVQWSTQCSCSDSNNKQSGSYGFSIN